METKTIKHFVKLLLLTLIISYVIDKVIFFGLNRVSDKVMSGQSIGKLNQFLSIKDSLDVVVFGNSRANHHIRVSEFDDNSYNMGINGVGIAYSSTLINTLPKNGEQIVIVHIDTKNFFDQDYDGSDIRFLKTKYHRETAITEALDESGMAPALQNIYYSMSYNGGVLGIFKNYFKPNYNYKNYDGYDPLFVSESREDTRDFILEKDIDTACKDNHEVNPIALKYLDKIKSFVEQTKTTKTFLFVTSPIYNDNCTIDNEILNEIMDKYGLKLWDFTNLFKDIDDKILWKDKTHMSNKGAKIFTEKMYSEFKVINN